MSMSIKARKGYAKMLHEEAEQFLIDGLEAWPDDPEMEECARADADDLHELAQIILHKGPEKALKMMRSLDTSARDNIPDMIWDALVRDEDEDVMTKQEWHDEVLCRHVATLKYQRDELNEKIDDAMSLVGTEPLGTMEEGLMSDHYHSRG